MWLLLPDLHLPCHNIAALNAVKDFAKKNSERIEGFVWMGDQLDLAEISHHTISKPGLRKRGALRANLEEMRGILREMEALMPKAKRVWINGNHERFVQKDLQETNPELDGMLDLEEWLGLRENGYTVVPQGGEYRIGKLTVIHGDTVGGGIYVARKAAEVYAGTNVVMGHVHFFSSHTRQSPASAESRWGAWTLGTLGVINPNYARNKANACVNGFGVVERFPDGAFNLFPIVVSRGRFAYGGRVYGGAL